MAARASTMNNGSYGELYQWLECNQISAVKLETDFIDGVECDSLLARAFPECEQISLSHQKTFEGRVENWRKLNSKSLTKLGLPLERSFIKRLALGTTGTIQTLLIEIMELFKAKEPLDLTDDIMLSLEEDDVFVAEFPMQLGETEIRAKRKMIKRERYQILKQQIKAKEQYLYAIMDDLKVMQKKLNTVGPMCERDLEKFGRLANEFTSLIAEHADESKVTAECDVEECYQDNPKRENHKKKHQAAKREKSAKSTDLRGQKTTEVKTTNKRPQKGIPKHTDLPAHDRPIGQTHQSCGTNKKAHTEVKLYTGTSEHENPEPVKGKNKILVQRNNARKEIAKHAKGHEKKEKAVEPMKVTGTKSEVFIGTQVAARRGRRATSRR